MDQRNQEHQDSFPELEEEEKMLPEEENNSEVIESLEDGDLETQSDYLEGGSYLEEYQDYIESGIPEEGVVEKGVIPVEASPPVSQSPIYPPREPARPYPETGGVLFSPANDPLRELPLEKEIRKNPPYTPWISKRLRHLVSEPQQPFYKEFSGRRVGRG